MINGTLCPKCLNRTGVIATAKHIRVRKCKTCGSKHTTAEFKYVAEAGEDYERKLPHMAQTNRPCRSCGEHADGYGRLVFDGDVVYCVRCFNAMVEKVKVLLC